jgi:hypothetical protein
MFELINKDKLLFILKNDMIKYCQIHHSYNYGLVVNVMVDETKSLLDNIEYTTNKKFIIKNNVIYWDKITQEINNDMMNNTSGYPDPVISIFIDNINKLIRDTYL